MITGPEETHDQGNNPLSSRGKMRRAGCSAAGVGAHVCGKTEPEVGQTIRKSGCSVEPWLTFVSRQLTLEIKFREEEKCDGREIIQSLRVS